MEQSKLMARLAYQALDDKKGEDIQVIDISQVSVLADYFIIANGNSESQVRKLGADGFRRDHRPCFRQRKPSVL